MAREFRKKCYSNIFSMKRIVNDEKKLFVQSDKLSEVVFKKIANLQFDKKSSDKWFVLLSSLLISPIKLYKSGSFVRSKWKLDFPKCQFTPAVDVLHTLTSLLVICELIQTFKTSFFFYIWLCLLFKFQYISGLWNKKMSNIYRDITVLSFKWPKLWIADKVS